MWQTEALVELSFADVQQIASIFQYSPIYNLIISVKSQNVPGLVKLLFRVALNYGIISLAQ